MWFHLQPRKSGSSLTKARLLLSSFVHFPAAALAQALPVSQAAPLLLPSTAMTHQKAETKARFLLWSVCFPFCLFFGHFSEVNQLTASCLASTRGSTKGTMGSYGMEEVLGKVLLFPKTTQSSAS